MWLTCCRQAGLSLDDMSRLRVDQAEAVVTMAAFWADTARGDEDGRQAAVDSFFG